MMKPILCIVLHFAEPGSSNVLKRGIYDLPAIAQAPIVPADTREIVTVSAYNNPGANRIARALDAKVEMLIRSAL
jgi:hypothetical protein